MKQINTALAPLMFLRTWNDASSITSMPPLKHLSTASPISSRLVDHRDQAARLPRGASNPRGNGLCRPNTHARRHATALCHLACPVCAIGLMYRLDEALCSGDKGDEWPS